LLLAICPRLTVDQAGALAEICDHLPIALMLAGAYLHHRPVLVQVYIHSVCGAASVAPAGLATLLDITYRALGVDQQAVLRALSVMVADFDWDAALYVGQAESILDETRALTPDHTLDDLVDHGLLQYDAWAQRFRWHDLVRAFVRSRATAGELDAADYRYASYYNGILFTTRRLYPQGGEHATLALHILAREWKHIQAGQSWAAARAEEETNVRESSPATRLCNDYADAGLYALRLCLPARERIRWLAAARAAAHRLGEADAEGAHLVNLGNAYDELCDYRNAAGSYKKALEIIRKIGDPYSEAWVPGSLGNTYKRMNDPRRAIVYFEEKLEINRKIGDRSNEGITFGHLGSVYADLGDTRLAIESYEQYLAISRELRDSSEEAIASWNLGLIYEQLGDLPHAIAAMQICVAYENEHNHPDAANDATHVAALRARLNTMPSQPSQ
jgi:tetratricopeptide (TPR) repeat protein